MELTRNILHVMCENNNPSDRKSGSENFDQFWVEIWCFLNRVDSASSSNECEICGFYMGVPDILFLQQTVKHINEPQC